VHISRGYVGDFASQIEAQVPSLRRFAWALLRDDAAADDLVQDCLERALTRWHLRRQDANLRAWLFAILHNLYISDWRQKVRRGEHLALSDLASEPEVAATQETTVIYREALDALRHLPDDQRTVLLLVGVEDLSYQDAAKIVGVPIGTIMSRLSRARERLRQLIEGGPSGATLRLVK